MCLVDASVCGLSHRIPRPQLTSSRKCNSCIILLQLVNGQIVPEFCTFKGKKLKNWIDVCVSVVPEAADRGNVAENGSVNQDKVRFDTLKMKLHPSTVSRVTVSTSSVPSSPYFRVQTSITNPGTPAHVIGRPLTTSCSTPIKWEPPSTAAAGGIRPSIPRLTVSALLQDGAFMVRKSSGQDAQQPYTLVVFYKGRVYNIPVRLIPTTQQYALGREKKGEEVRRWTWTMFFSSEVRYYSPQRRWGSGETFKTFLKQKKMFFIWCDHKLTEKVFRLRPAGFVLYVGVEGVVFNRMWRSVLGS